MSENRDALSLKEQRTILDRIAIVIIGLVYSSIPGEVSKAPHWGVYYHDNQAILTINFDWWLPFEKITIKEIKSAVIMALRGSSIELGDIECDDKNKTSSSKRGYDFFIYLKNGQKITIGRYESKGRKSNHSVVVMMDIKII